MDMSEAIRRLREEASRFKSHDDQAVDGECTGDPDAITYGDLRKILAAYDRDERDAARWRWICKSADVELRMKYDWGGGKTSAVYTLDFGGFEVEFQGDPPTPGPNDVIDELMRQEEDKDPERGPRTDCAACSGTGCDRCIPGEFTQESIDA